jgi:hypothetical protein
VPTLLGPLPTNVFQVVSAVLPVDVLLNAICIKPPPLKKLVAAVLLANDTALEYVIVQLDNPLAKLPVELVLPVQAVY